MKYLAPVVRFFVSLARPSPERDWRIVLAAALLLGAALIGNAIYFYVGLQSGAIIAPREPTRSPAPTLSRAELSRALDFYRARALNYEAGNIAVPSTANIR